MKILNLTLPLILLHVTVEHISCLQLAFTLIMFKNDQNIPPCKIAEGTETDRQYDIFLEFNISQGYKSTAGK